MTYEVSWSEDALNGAAAHLDDPVGLTSAMDGAAALARDPRPENAFVMGPGQFRLKVGRYRLYYVVDDRTRTVVIVRCGRTP